MGKINSEVIRVAVVGAGNMAKKVHLPSIATIKGVEIVGICEINLDLLKLVTETYKIPKSYTDARKMIEETKPDAVYVLGQPQVMYDIWVWCLQRGLNLYVEKPMGINMHQALNLVHLAKENDCITQVSLQRRNSPLFKQMMAKCLEKGPVVHGVSTFTKPTEGPIYKAYDEMYDVTIHAIDTLRAICGGEIVKIDSFTSRVNIPNINVIHALFQFSNGSTGILMNNHISGRRTFSFEIHCPNICAVADLEAKGAIYFPGQKAIPGYPDIPEGDPYDAIEAAGSSEYYVYGGYKAKHEEFIQCVRSGEQPSSCFSDALKTQQAGEVILSQTLFRESVRI